VDLGKADEGRVKKNVFPLDFLLKNKNIIYFIMIYFISS
jgi:hypothetical protein